MLTITPFNSMMDAARVARLKRVRGVFAMVVTATSAIVLTGWAIGNVPMTSILPGLISMKVNTAIALVALAIAMQLLNSRGRKRRIVFASAAAVACLISIATLAEYIFRIDLHIDNLFVIDRDSARFPGRLSPLTACCLLGLVGSYVSLNARRAISLAQLLLLVISAAPLMTLSAYLYHVPSMYSAAPYPVVALNTSVALMLLCLGGLMESADEGLMGIVTSNSMAGTLSRRLLPAAAGLPLLTGLLVLAGERANLYTTAFGSAMLIACCAAFFACAVCLTVTHLWNIEVINRSAQQETARLLVAERAARAQAEEADRLKNEFLSVVSHELRTPLTAILGWAQLMQRKANDAELDEALNIIVDNAKAQRQIIGDLLDMGRIVSGKLRLQLEAVELRGLIESAAESIRPAAAAKEICFEIDSSLTDQRVQGDPDRLQQIFWNLFSNAVKFTGRGGRIRVQASLDQNSVSILVIDNGCGIASEFLPHAFDRFRQADASTSRLHGGLGLGLSIVKQLVELHGGTVSAQSPGRGLGATFGVVLPLLPNTNQRENASVGAIAGSRVDLSGLRILVVDDEPHMRMLIQRELESARASVEAAGSGEEAFELLRAQPFHAMISDVGMPAEDGYALVRRMRASGAAGRLPAIALTAYARPEDQAQALDAGFVRHMSKPFDPRELVEVVAQVVRAAAAATE